MILTENRLYTSQELKPEIHIADNASVLIYDEENILEKVSFGKNANLKYFGYFSNSLNSDNLSNLPQKEKEENRGIYNKHFFVNGE